MIGICRSTVNRQFCITKEAFVADRSLFEKGVRDSMEEAVNLLIESRMFDEIVEEPSDLTVRIQLVMERGGEEDD